jgi:hypothetical protein
MHGVDLGRQGHDQEMTHLHGVLDTALEALGGEVHIPHNVDVLRHCLGRVAQSRLVHSRVSVLHLIGLYLRFCCEKGGFIKGIAEVRLAHFRHIFASGSVESVVRREQNFDRLLKASWLIREDN